MDLEIGKEYAVCFKKTPALPLDKSGGVGILHAYLKYEGSEGTHLLFSQEFKNVPEAKGRTITWSLDAEDIYVGSIRDYELDISTEDY